MAKVSPLLQSWSLRTWQDQAPHVWPGNGELGRTVIRHHKAELHAAGALTRIGRELIIIGAGYQKWLASNAARVTDYDVPMNRPEHAAKRRGGKVSQ